MKSISGKELAQALERHGWKLKRVNDSHYIYAREGSVLRLSVPIHGSQPLKRGLLLHLLKQADLLEIEI